MHVNFMFVVALLAMKRQEDQPKHVERRQQRGGKSEPIKNVSGPASAVFVLKSAQQDGILAKEARKRRETRDCQCCSEHGEVRPADLFAEPAHAVHVLLAAHGVNHAARREEEKCFEKGMRHQMKNASGERANATSEKHVAQLADRGIRQNLLDI